MIYCYRIVMGKATLTKMRSNGNDCDDKPKLVGVFSNDKLAKEACLSHHAKACKMALAAKRDTPTVLWV